MSASDSSCPTSFLHRDCMTTDQDHSQRMGGDASARRLDEHLDTVEAAVQQVLRFAETTAQLLADTVGRGHDAEHYLRMIFTRGVYLHPLPPVSPHFPVAGVQVSAEAHLRREFTEEFNGLTGERKQNLLEVLMTEGAPALESLTVRSPPSSRAQDLDNIFEIIKGLVLFLKCRCGVDGFVCLAKNNDAYQLRPQWFFSSPNIDRFLSRVVGKWDAGLIGLRLEAFALSGCNMDSLLYTMGPQWYPRWLRHEIQDKIDTLLAQTTGLADVTMDYNDYEGAILVRFGIALVGWTHEIWACPSELPLDVEPLEGLLQAVKTGECYFQHLSAEEHIRCIDEYEERLATRPQEHSLRLGRKLHDWRS